MLPASVPVELLNRRPATTTRCFPNLVMSFRCRTIALACLGAAAAIPSSATAGARAGACGFVAPRASFFRRTAADRCGRRMTASKDPEAATPYSELPANWRAPLQREDPVKKGTEAAETQAEQPGDRTDGTRSEIFNVRTSAQVLEELERVPSVAPGDGFSARRAIRKPDPPPDIGRFQTNSQRRRNLPLSKLKRVKPKKRRVDDDEGEYRPLLPKTDRESVLRGEDYWIDYRELMASDGRTLHVVAPVSHGDSPRIFQNEVDANAARKEARTKPPAPDQFAQAKMRAEISNPYKQNWILAISIAFVAMAGFIKLNPGIMDDAVITFPTEL